MKSLLTAKQSGNSEKGSKGGHDCSRNQSQIYTSSKGNHTDDQLSPLQVNFDQSMKSASPTMRQHLGCSPSMNTSTKKLFQMRVGRFKQLHTEQEAPLLQLHKLNKHVSTHREQRSNCSDGTPVFSLPLNPRTLKLQNLANLPKEFSNPGAQPSADSSFNIGRARDSMRISVKNSDSVKNSSHYRIAPGCGGSASSKAGGRLELLQGSGTSPKMSS